MTAMKFIAGPCVIESAELLDTVAERLVDVGQQAQPPLRPHVGEHTQPLFESGAAERGDRGAVGLVERRLEDDVRAESFVDRHKTLRHGVKQFGRLDDARSGDKFDLHKIRL